MVYHLEFRTMHLITEEEKRVLRDLTIKPIWKISMFRQLLNHSNPLGIYVSLLKDTEEIVCWSAASTRDGWNLGTVGVFVREDYRREGLARKVLNHLLVNLSKIEGSPEYLYYEKGRDRLFVPSIEANGFIPYWKHDKEYRKKELIASGVDFGMLNEVIEYYSK